MRPPDRGQIEALNHALLDIDFPHWEDRLFHYPDDRMALASTILEALPYGWELVTYTHTGPWEDDDAEAP